MYPIERYLSRLKSYVHNKTYPEGSIAEGNVEESTGAVVSITLDSTSWIQAHRYVLFNCEEITPFRDVHIAEIKAGFPFHVTDDVIQKQHIEEFCPWFREYVMSMDASKRKELSDKVRWFARYPDNETSTLEMGRRKTNLRTHSKSLTLERASSQDADEVRDQETHEASTQDVQPAVRVTRGASKYLDVWDLPDDEEIELSLNSLHQPVDDGARTFTGFLGTIARKPHMCPIRYLNWKNMPEELKEECWRVVEIQSEKNKDRRSKQDELHTAGSCSYAVHAAKKAKTDGQPVERAVLYQVLHTRKDGTAVNPVVKAKMDKMKELLEISSNQLQSSDTSGSIAWSPDDVFAKVMGKERKGRIRGVGFGPTPSGRSSKSVVTDIEIHSSQARDNEVAQLKASLATMEEKLAGFDEMKQKLSQFEEMEQRIARMFQQISPQCNQDVPLAEHSPSLPKSSAASYQPSSL
ncbi:hypothetical protein CMV_008466 [Castanea mollissima]|uniref:DUF4218 domain-containing protein n=1 Tax=Castanea mollissima TaxID=60419 RepID=A0A8J4RRS8_9ROSI|nr:hypothetical protein CMV_008466 [Castanea mollissima]